MWTVIFIAHSKRMAEAIQTKLTAEGFLINIRQAKGSKQQFEILVPESELDEIQEILNTMIQ
ncbi:glutamate decarboxylase [Ammoniphilus oxalaticus]|uniref:Glutamate decarboxylase n=1 Tax=Ammoniphilus oxalaticus TaxID=66863 RepID=A0A419SIJ6_9BACL|nr:glutamate decarboxylase [Ammoniphilus oxalaticus]RKD23779.1 glutamate decarboxylase [Ammoniphilus oxalaticus]